MKFGMLAVVTVLVAGFFVLEAPAQTTIPSSGPVITTSDYQVVQPARTGLFGRLRNRNNNTVSSASMTTAAPGTIVQTGVPMPLPGTIAQASGTTTVPAAAATTTTPVMNTTMTMQNQPRQGLFSRLRARMGR